MALDPLPQHATDRLNLEAGAWMRLQRIFRKAKREMTARMVKLLAADKATTIQGRHTAAILQQVSVVLGESVPTLVASLAHSTGLALGLGASQVLTEMAATEPVPALVAAINAVIPIDAVIGISDPQQALLTRFGDGISQSAADSLGVSLTVGEGIRPAARRLGQEIEKKSWELQRIARTEINKAMNAARLAQMQEVALDFPEMNLMKQWSASGDERCCENCDAMDGQFRRLDQDFTSPGGWSGDAPPAHPNCRCSCVAYQASFGKQPEYGQEPDSPDLAEEEGMEDIEAAARIGGIMRNLADLPASTKTLSPSTQNAVRKALNRLAKDGPSMGAVHVDAVTPPKRRRRLIKSDDAQRYTLGVVYEPGVEDTQEDFADAAEIEQACWGFNRRHIGNGQTYTDRLAKGALGIQHATWFDSHGEIIESYITPADMTIGAELVTKGTWLMGTIWSQENWAKVQRGELTGYSLGGKARREAHANG